MAERAIYCYAWDLADKGVAAAVDRFQESGLNAVTMAGSYHAGKFLRPHAGDGKVYFPEDGTITFRPDGLRYGELKPIENSILERQDVLGSLCERGDVAVNAWLVLMHNSRLGGAYPHVTVENAFGDRLIYSLCPSAPACREYVLALCADVAASYRLAAITLESPGFLPFVHGYHHEFALVRQNVWLNNLLGLCFCDHCRRGAADAGIDAKNLRDRVKQAVEHYLVSEVDFADDMAAAFWLADTVLDPDLGVFLRWRCDVVTSLVRDIRAAVRPQVDVRVIPSVARPTGGAWYEGSDLAALAGTADRIEACFYEPEVSRIASDLLDVRRRIGGAGKLAAVLRPGYPDLNNAASVGAAIAVLAEAGVHDVAFYNYGHLRPRALDWIAAALAAQDAGT